MWRHHTMAVVTHGSRTTARILSYVQSLKIIQTSAIQLRRYSGFENSDSNEIIFTQEDSNTVWPDDVMGPLSPQDKRFPLPGNVGTAPLKLPKTSRVSDAAETLEGLTRCDREIGIVSQLISESDFLDESSETEVFEKDIIDTMMHKYFESSNVEIAVQDCPKILYKDFSSTFVEMPRKNITVLTVTQKTKSDMTSWSERVEKERELLLQNFISTAKEICHLLRANNFWCDFIDPSSGLPYFGQYTNSTLFETNDCYNSLGFKIEDLGCCKVITHKRWGSRIFVGSVLTTASKDNETLIKLISSVG